MSPSTDPAPQLTPEAAHELYTLIGEARLELFHYYRGQGSCPTCRYRLRRLSFAILDAVGWPPGEEGLDQDEEHADDRYRLTEDWDR